MPELAVLNLPLLDLALCLMILGTALATIAGAGVYRSIMFFVIYGLFVSLAWVRIGAIDVALAESAIGAGLTGVLLVSAAGRLPHGSDEAPRHPAAAALATALGGVLIWAWFVTPEAPGLSAAVAENLSAAGVGNPVTAVLLNYRAWDTLLEAVVLIVALLGVWMLARDADWGNPLGPRQHARPGGVMATLGRVVPPVGLMIGVYIVWAGAEQPGGAFQGGTVLAAVGLLAAMAGHLQAPAIHSRAMRVGLVLGPLVFLGAGLLTLVFGAGFLTWPEAYAKPIIVVVEIVLTLSIVLTLGLLVLGQPLPQPVEPDEGKG